MPVYATFCNECQREASIFRKIAERDENLPICCGTAVHRIIKPISVVADIQPYQSPTDGKWVDSRKQRKEDLLRSNAIPWEPGLDQDIARKAQYNKDKAFAPLAAAVDETVSQMVAAGKLET